MRASACVGRVGGLAVALGIGAAVAVGYAGSAAAAPADDSATVNSAAAGAAAPSPRSLRSVTPKAAASQRNDIRHGPGPADRVQTIAAAAAAPEAPVALAAPVNTAQSSTRLAAVGLSNDIAVRRPAASRIAAKTSSANSAKTASANSANPILSLLFNQTPTDSPTRTAQSSTGVITGDLNGSDEDGDVITYAVVSNPMHGVVVVDSAGHYVYTPDADLVASGGADTFAVQVSDDGSGFHVHGIMGLINLLTFGLIGSAGHTTTTTVTLSVLAATVTNGVPSASTGVLTGTVISGGAPGDQFAYTGSSTSKGTAVVDPATGDFTYTPTAQARHAAANLNATSADKSDTFTIGITDTRGGAMYLPVTTAITPANNAPTGTQGPSGIDAMSGVVAGAVIGMDADGDPLTYTGSTTTAKGTVVVNNDGSFTYTPTALARHSAAFNADTGDSFTVTVADGYGGSVSVPVSVAVSPASVTFSWATGSGSQFWTPANMAALNTAATRLSSYIVAGAPVTITTTLIGQNNPGSNFLASSYTNFVSSGAGYYGTVVQAKILTGTDANGSSADSQLTWNFAYPWALGDTVPGNQYDFQSVAMHEIVHSLGFLSGIGGPGSTDTNWSTYDRFLSTSTGASVINSNYTWNSAYTANLTGANGGLYFDGPNAVAVYGGPVPLYTPGTWTSGSSVTHLNATPVKPTGTTAYLMDPSDGYGAGVRAVTPVEIGILRDLGYTIVTPSGASVFFIVGFGLIRRRRR